MKRRSLATVLALALALILGVSSLAGSTIAWFTENVTSSGNKIQSGTLDVEMKYFNDVTNKWEDVEPTTQIIDTNRLYMPGSIEVVLLQAENAGSLALKYKLGITAVNKTIGISVNGKTIKLTDYLQAGAWVLDGKDFTEADFAGYSDVLEIIKADSELSADQRKMKPLVEFEETEIEDVVVGTITKEQKASVLISDRKLPAAPAAASTEPAQNTETFALVFYMPAEIGNDMNFRGQQPQIAVGVHLLAGQATIEEDSFDANYDQDAIYPAYSTHEELLAKQPSTTEAEPASETDAAEAGTNENENP